MPYKDKRTGKWVARVQVNNKRFHVGYFKTKKEAHQAELKKQRELTRLFKNTIETKKLTYEETEHPSWFLNLRAWLKLRREEKAKDKVTTEKLERL